MENSQELLCSTELTEERGKTLKEVSSKGKDFLKIHCMDVQNYQIVGKPTVQDDL